MSDCWIMEEEDGRVLQTPEVRSFIGGKPVLPLDVDIPRCCICGKEQSFFFQVAFPGGHPWAGLTVAAFMCTACSDETNLIPEMLKGPLLAVDIPADFLNSYQKNFRFVVFKSTMGEVKNDYLTKVCYKPLLLKPLHRSNTPGDKVGGEPTWILDDETPGSYAGKYDMAFLMQLSPGKKFYIESSAPPQMELGLTGKPQPSPNNYYQLFNGNGLFMFGVCGYADPLVYALTQI